MATNRRCGTLLHSLRVHNIPFVHARKRVTVTALDTVYYCKFAIDRYVRGAQQYVPSRRT